MSGANQRRKSSVTASGAKTPHGGTVASGPVKIFASSVWWQLLGLVGLSCALGFTFNASSPLGIRFGTVPAASASPAPPKAAGASAASSTPSPALPVKPGVLPPLPPAPVKAAPPATPPQTQAALPPKPVAPAAPPPWSVPVKPANPNPIAAVVAPPPAQTNPAPIHWPEAKTLAAEGRAVLVDVRHKAMYDAGHIPGAMSLPEMSPPEEFKTFLGQQPTNVMVIVYCSSTSCSQSARVANRLVNEFRWPSVRYMTGGYQEYQQIEGARLHAPPAP